MNKFKIGDKVKAKPGTQYYSIYETWGECTVSESPIHNSQYMYITSPIRSGGKLTVYTDSWELVEKLPRKKSKFGEFLERHNL